MRSHIAGLVGVLLLGAGSAAAQEQAQANVAIESAAGVYSLVRVNARAVPAPSWVRRSADATCNTETRAGTLLLDSKGRWASFMTERDRCQVPNAKREIYPEVSTLSTGDFTIRGDVLELRDGANGATYTGKIEGNLITVTVAGTGALDGQTMAYSVRRMRQVR